MNDDISPDFSKGDGLVPAIVQSARTGEVLMLGYMNEEAYGKTRETGLVTFYSRSRNSLWTKGETSGNVLRLRELTLDCDSDAILVLADPVGPTCHTGKSSCFFKPVYSFKKSDSDFSLYDLEAVIRSRKDEGSESSYTCSLFENGIRKITQKVGEEATEVVIAALTESDEKFLEESADLMFHYMILLAEKGKNLGDVEKVLCERHKQ